MSNVEVNPFFKFDDIKCDDLKEQIYLDPYYYLRRPIEPERLKTIYQQAFIFDLLYRFAKEYLPNVQEVPRDRPDLIENEKTTDTTIDSIKEKVLEYLFKNQVEIKDVKKDEGKQEVSVESLWNENEMNILRKNFAQIKEENISLNSRLKVLIEENKLLRENIEKITNETKFMPDEIKTLEKENERMYIRVVDMESRYVNYSKELEELDETIKDLRQRETELKSKLQELTSEKLKQEFEINKLNSKLNSCKNELKSYFMAKCERYKLKYLKQIQELNIKLKETEELLNQEKAAHNKCKTALEQLRTHFMYAFVPGDNCSKIDESKISII